MYTTLLQEPTPVPFNFNATVRAHGWAALQPFNWDNETEMLSRIHQLNSGEVVRLAMAANRTDTPDRVRIKIESSSPLAGAEEQEIRQAVRHMLRLDEDLTEFYRLKAEFEDWSLNVVPGGGRLLRCPRLFEDVVYTLCTTNISWSGTKRMVAQLVEGLGEPHPALPSWRAFPSPQRLAEAGVESLQTLGLGYRASYLWQLATDVVDGRLDLEALTDQTRSTEEVLRELLRLKGVGRYAAATILMLLGRYGYLAIDSEMRAMVSRKYHDGAPITDAEIEERYASWGDWRYLAYWFDSA